MTEQLALVEIPAEPKLTGRQEMALAALEHAAHDGLATDEVGALLHASRSIHGTDTRCVYCAQTGREVLEALKAKGLARYRRANHAKSLHGAWLVANLPADPPADTKPGNVPYNEFPEGF